jgi:hypothetical protein
LLIQTRGEVIQAQPKRGAKSAPSVLWLTLSIPMDGLGDAEIAKLSRFLHGPTIGLTLDLGPFVAAGTGASGRGQQATIEDVAPTRARRPERVMPLPEERCQRCYDRIGEDPDRRFYAPLVGAPLPMHGRCADLSDGERDEGAALAPPDAGTVEPIPAEEEPAPGTMQPTAAGAPLEPEQRERGATGAGAIVAVGKLTMSDAGLMLVDVELVAPPPEPVPTELPGGVVAIGAEGEVIGADWPSTTDPRPGRVADPEAAAALGDLAPHLERVASEVDRDFETLVGPSAATRKRRARAPAGA